MNLTPEAREAYKAGVADGTIKCSIEKLINTVLAQEVVSYCSKKGTYTFDYFDVVPRCGGLMR
tara:strand:+ start:128 stop:316 length:189 start_codon:yes stop_codon:yes gene_type:complete